MPLSSGATWEGREKGLPRILSHFGLWSGEMGSWKATDWNSPEPPGLVYSAWPHLWFGTWCMEQEFPPCLQKSRPAHPRLISTAPTSPFIRDTWWLHLHHAWNLKCQSGGEGINGSNVKAQCKPSQDELSWPWPGWQWKCDIMCKRALNSNQVLGAASWCSCSTKPWRVSRDPGGSRKAEHRQDTLSNKQPVQPRTEFGTALEVLGFVLFGTIMHHQASCSPFPHLPEAVLAQSCAATASEINSAGLCLWGDWISTG